MKLSYNNYTARFCDGGVEVFKGDTLLYYNKRPMYAFIKTALAVTEFYDAPYETITEKDGSILAEGILRSPTGSQLHFSDSYGISDGALSFAVSSSDRSRTRMSGSTPVAAQMLVAVLRPMP